MIPEDYVIADLHFHHEKSWKEFKDHRTGGPLRPFTSTQEMNVTLIENWNKVVRPIDRVFVLGDVCWGDLGVLEFLFGNKILIGGNHDKKNAKEYLKYFTDVRGVWVYKQAVLTHVPVHPSALGRKWRGNVHGHLHDRVVVKEVEVDTGIGSMPVDVPDDRYACVSVEQTNFTPVHLKTLIKRWPKNESSTEA